jgi:hypothetical protein
MQTKSEDMDRKSAGRKEGDCGLFQNAIYIESGKKRLNHK